MSLFGSLQLASNTLNAMQIGLQVVGNNIANANTPGYIREEVLYSPAPVQEIGNLTLGLGVQIDGIVQKVDEFLNERLRNAQSDRASAKAQSEAYGDLETLVGELSSTDLSTSLTTFFNSVDDVATNPGEDTASFRNLAIGNGQTLANDIKRLNSRGNELRGQYDQRVNDAASEINLLTEEIRQLNLRITTVEGGGASGSDAGSLRSQRTTALAKLSEQLDISVIEQPSGAVNVSLNGTFLVFEAQRSPIEVLEIDNGGGQQTTVLRFADSGRDIEPAGGALHGLITARDEIIGGFQDNLNELTQTLIFEFNKLYSQGQGDTGFQSLTSVEAVDNVNAPLDAAGLPFTPASGSFQILLQTEGSDVPTPHDIFVNLDGLDGDTSLKSLAEQINAIEGINASIDKSNRLTIETTSADTQFFFAEDPNTPSGVLASLGLNTFFTGDSADSIGVNSELNGIQNAARFASGLLGPDGRPTGNENSLRLATFFERKLDARGGVTLAGEYDQLINDITRGAVIAKSVTEGFESFEATLAGEQQAISGVSIDEEAIDMITLQRIYQASARYIQSISELLDVLVNL